jgi:zinc transport system ATP-binding protein
LANDTVIELQKVWVHYNSTPILQGIDLSVEQYDFLGVIGPNGGGKTTLLKVILGLVEPSSGSVAVLGGAPQNGRSKLGYVPQYNLFDRDFPINVWEAALMGCYGHTGLFRRYSEEDKESVRRALQTVGMLEQKDRQMGKLSGGEQQRVFIARALVAKPQILLLDEPTASVDSTMQTEFYDLLHRLKDRMAIILVSHDISAVSVHVDKIACLNRQLFYHGTPEIEAAVLEATYQCPVQMIAHGTIPHRVLKEH